MLKSRKRLIIVLLLSLLNLGLLSKGNVLSRVYFRKGVRALNQENYPEAIAQLKKAYEISQDSREIRDTLTIALNNYALLLEDVERDRAIELLEEAIAIDPKSQLLKKNLASVYNAWGLKLEKEKKEEEEIEKFRKAVELSPGEKVYRKNLGMALGNKSHSYFKEGDYEAAVGAAEEASQYIRDNKAIWIILGDSYNKLDNLEEAINCWQKALSLSPQGDTDLNKRIERAKREKLAQKDFKIFRSSYFTIKFSPGFDRGKATEIYTYVKDAIWTVGRDLGLYPKGKFLVFIYESDQFKMISGGYKHISGLYDGKIHLNIANETAPGDIAGVVRHEYTHAVIFWINQGRCPLWINEGLACYEESRDKEIDLRDLKEMAREGKLIPLAELSKACAQLADYKETSLAYKQAYSLVKFIIDEYGFWKVRKMLASFGEGKGEKAVLKEILRIDPEELEEEWKEKLLYE